MSAWWMGRLALSALRLCVSLAAAACSPSDGLSVAGSPGSELLAEGPMALVQEAQQGRESFANEGASLGYPLHFAPLSWQESRELSPSVPASGQQFGRAVAIDGDMILVGAPKDSGGGAVFVFARSAGAWPDVETQAFRPSDVAAGDDFGSALAFDGDTALVGAPGDDDAGSASGSAYVFTRSASNWSEARKMVASDAADADRFGSAVALSGESALVGAIGNDDAGSGSGSGYIFVRAATAWPQNEDQKLLASDAAASDRFGASVALSGDSAVVGAYGDDDAGSSSGSAYVFVRNAASWPATETQKLVASDAAPTDEFGQSVGISGDTALVGTPRDDDAGSASGSAYAFVRSAAIWPATETQKLVASDGAYGDTFGRSVVVWGEVALVSAPADDDAGDGSGSVYAFVRSAGAWTSNEAQKLLASDGAADDWFGVSLALSGGHALVGTPWHYNQAGMRTGTVYAFSLKLTIGESCLAGSECHSAQCVDGVCCESGCEDACGACNQSGLEGLCRPVDKGSSASVDCGGYLCNGNVSGCSNECSGDGDCEPSRYCLGGAACVSKLAEGEACSGDKTCLSGHCVEGLCCNDACDGGCGSCVLVEAPGICTPLSAGHPGEPGCGSYLCSGADTSCPNTCSAQSACASGSHCADDGCWPEREHGADCSTNAACVSGHCTNAVCCAAASCGAYRCGSAGACELACRSSAQCAQGHECNSDRRCELISDAASKPTESGGCAMATGSVSDHDPLRWLVFLLASGGAVGGRRRFNVRKRARP